MWILFALGAAILTGCVPLLGALPSRMLGAGRSALIRAGIVLIGAGILAIRGGNALPFSDGRAWAIFLAAGLADAVAWLFFYRALADGSLEDAVIREKMCVPISIALTCILAFRAPKFTEWAAILLFVGGILLATRKSRSILPFLSAVCTAIQIQLSKMGIERLGSRADALFLRSFFALIFLFALTPRKIRSKLAVNVGSGADGSLILSGATDSGATEAKSRRNALLSSVLLAVSGACAFFAWSFTFSALERAPAPQVQAITKLNFWITGLYLTVRTRSVNRAYWLAYAAMTVGAFVLIAQA